MSWGDRIEATMAVMLCIMGTIVALILLAAVFAAAPGAVISVLVLAAVSFGLTFVPQIYRNILKKWENRK